MKTHYKNHDPTKHFFPLPNEIFSLGLSTGEIAVYAYLMFCEDRETYQCYPGYKTIGKALQMSTNTVRKYVSQSEDKHLYRAYYDTFQIRDKEERQFTLHHITHRRCHAILLR